MQAAILFKQKALKLLRFQRFNFRDEIYTESYGMNSAQWPTLKARLIEVFKDNTRQQCCDILEGSDVCFEPVFDRSICDTPAIPTEVGADTEQVLTNFGLCEEQMAKFVISGAVLE